MRRRSPWLVAVSRLLVPLVVLAMTILVLSACDGCRPTGATSAADARGATPTVRLHFLSDVAGALEPCGCVKDQLGGMDHFGALSAEGRKAAKAHGTLAVGPTFFMDMVLTEERKAQEVEKATTLAGALKAVDLVAFAPGRNDWAAGDEALAKLREQSGASMLAANLTPAGPAVSFVVREMGGLKLGFVGVAAPDKAQGAPPPPGLASSAAIEAVTRAAAAARAEGARAVIVLGATGRGEAKRIADALPDLLAVVVGTTGTSGEINTEPAPAERLGDVLVVQPANHVQTAGELDLFLRDDGTGAVKFADASDAAVPAPATGSFYRYTAREVRQALGADDAVKAQMLAYYKSVNEANKVAFKDKKPIAPKPGEPRYVGVSACESCHEDAKSFWDKTAHARAYPTLTKEFKEFNLDCVSCHVTGYDRPGGSTVTHVAELQNVQCEVCHGPGELHAKKPEKVHMPIPSPSADMCTSCHHPPHVHTFDARAKMAEILGPGHGQPLK